MVHSGLVTVSIENPAGTKAPLIAVLVPVTSRGRSLAQVAQADFVQHLLPSFLKTANWDGSVRYRMYVGYDAGDPVYDCEQARHSLGRIVTEAFAGKPADLVLLATVDTRDAPCWAWNQLARQALADGCDYFYQIGDDVEMETAGWAIDFPVALESNPLCPGLGVTGPRDRNNPRILTQSFVSRLHIQLFDSYFPSVFKNWWSDDWITATYTPDHTRAPPNRHVVNNAGGTQRYAIQKISRQVLDGEVEQARRRVHAWLTARTAAVHEQSPAMPTVHATAVFVQSHQSLGDHLIVNGLVRELTRKNGQVVLLCKSRNRASVIHMYRGAPVVVLEVENDRQATILASAHESLGGTVVRLGSFGRDFMKGDEHFDESFYRQAGVPFALRWDNFAAPRSDDEETVFSMVVGAGSYAFVHDTATHPIPSTRLPTLPVVRARPGVVDCLFAWRKVIDSATEVHCINSCFLRWIDSLHENGQRLVFHRYARHAEDPRCCPSLRRPWHVLS